MVTFTSMISMLLTRIPILTGDLYVNASATFVKQPGNNLLKVDAGGDCVVLDFKKIPAKEATASSECDGLYSYLSYNDTGDTLWNMFVILYPGASVRVPDQSGKVYTYYYSKTKTLEITNETV